MNKAQNYYDGISKGYKQLYHQEQIQKIKIILPYLPKEKNILLDLGSGDGVLNQFISKKINLISLDLSLELLKLNSNKNKICASCENLPFKNTSIEFISSFTVFQDLENPTKALEEIKRILKSKGFFILSFLHISKKAKEILNFIKHNFEIIKEIKEEKDYIFILKNK